MKQLLSMIQTYFSNLYNSQTTDAQDRFQMFTKIMEIPKLDDVERDALDGPSTFQECKKSLETFENGKSPGEDSFRKRSGFLKHLTIKNCYKTLRKNILKFC